MNKPVSSGRVVIATHNDGKLREFDALLKPYVRDVVSAGQLGLPAPDETGDSFVANAVLKANAATAATGNMAIADDSGLCVTALDGQPGIFSARWGNGKDFTGAMQRIIREIGTKPDRSAFFISVLALCWPDGHVETVEGRIDGTIAHEMRGTNGHGYDAIFIPTGETRTFAEMNDAEKNAISHRSMASKLLIDKFFAK